MCRHQPMRMILNPSSKGERVSGGIQCLLTGEQLYERRMLSVMPSNRNTVIMVFRQSGLTIQLYCLTVIRLARIRFDNRAIGRTRLRMTFNFLETLVTISWPRKLRRYIGRLTRFKFPLNCRCRKPSSKRE